MPFDVFGDFEEKGYLRNKYQEKNMDIIKKMEHIHFLNGLPYAIDYLSSSELKYKDLLKTHEILFSSLYPWAGQDRNTTMPDRTVTKGDVVFANPNQIEHEFRVAMHEDTIGKVLGGLAYAHPFLDGNGRALSCFMSEYQLRKGLVVRWDLMKRQEYLPALSQAIIGDSRDLDELLCHYSTKITAKQKKMTSQEILIVTKWSNVQEKTGLLSKIFGVE